MYGVILFEGCEQNILALKDSRILVYMHRYLAVNVTEFMSAFQRSQSYNLAAHMANQGLYDPPGSGTLPSGCNKGRFLRSSLVKAPCCFWTSS